MSYRNDRGILVEQSGKNGAAFVMMVDEDGNPSGAGYPQASVLTGITLQNVGDTYVFQSGDASHGLIHAVAFGTGTVVLEASITGNIWTPIVIIPVGNNGGSADNVSGFAGMGMCYFDAAAPMLRLRVTARTAGSFQFEIGLSMGVPVARSLAVTNTTTVQSSNGLSGVQLGMVSTNANSVVSSAFRLPAAAATTNPTSVKTSAAKLALIMGYNAATSVRYLKIFNKNAAPTMGTDTPVLNLPMPPSALFRFDLADIGLHLTSGLAFAITTGSADKDATAVTANDIVGLNIIYV